MYSSSVMVEDAVLAGADGYLVKNMSSAELIEALHTVCAGTKYFATEARRRTAI